METRQDHVVDVEVTDVDTFVFPMSFAQQRLWFLDEVAPGNPFYNIPLSVPLRGAVDAIALERSLNEIVRRHEPLRTTFRVIDGEPSQVVSASLHIAVTHHRLDLTTGTERSSALERVATVEARAPFDLRTGPLVRATLVALGNEEHVLLLTMHHIVADGWSVGILLREMTELYTAFSAGSPSPLADLAVQYADFAVWQRNQLHGERLERLLEYWREQLQELPALELPTDRLRPRVLDYTGAHVPVELDADLADAVRELARTERASPFMTLMAAFVCLLGRYTAQDDIVVGTPIANRNQAETEHIIGFFVNSLILRCDLSGEPTFRELLGRVRETCLDAYAHQDLPFERLVEELKPERDLSRNPLFQVTFQLVNTPTITTGRAHRVPTAPAVQRGSAIFDVAFTLVDSDGPLTGMIEFSTQLFDVETITRFVAHYRNLLSAVTADPDMSISEVPLITGRERELLVAQHTPPRADERPVLEAIARTIADAPDDIAVVADDGQLTFAELDARANQVARRLRSHGVASGDLVAILADASWLPVAMLGVLRAGGGYLSLDRSQPTNRVSFVLHDATPVLILADTASRALLPSTGIPIVDLDRPGAADGAPLVEAAIPASTAYMLYTAGSTGTPKGVVIPRAALDNHMTWMLDEFLFDSSDRILQRTTPIFDASVWEIWAPLMSGARLVVLGSAAKRDPAEIAAAVRRHGITILQVVPSLLRVLLDEPDFVTADSLRIVFSGGEPLTDDLQTRFQETFDAQLVNLYGPTEATIDATFHRCAKSVGRSVPIGRPIAGIGTIVLDKVGNPTPIGVPGKLYLSGAGLAVGYHGRPGLTAERFVPNEFGSHTGDRLYDTGDVVRFRTDGTLEFVGRSDQQVKVRGHRIELGELEVAIESCAGVRRAATVVDGERIVAFLTTDTSDDAMYDLMGEADKEAVDRWADVHEQQYGELTADLATELNTVGWTSSYTGDRIAEDAMRAWRDQTVERVLALEPRRVLEIGCGTGMILERVAPRTDHYVGTDLSARAIDYLEEKIAEGLFPAQVFHRPAHVLDEFIGEGFDIVVLNSVVQYFPSVRYLRDVLSHALECLGADGSIFVGDVRSLPLLPTFLSTVALHDTDDAEPGTLVVQRIEDALGEEEELVLAPEFFIDLATRIGLECEVLLKRTGHLNEMSLFRYDVVLRRRSATVASSPSIRLDWRLNGLDAGALDARLERRTDDHIVVSGIPDAALTSAVAGYAACIERAAELTGSQLRALVAAERGGITCEALIAAGAAHGYTVALRPSVADPPGHIEAVFTVDGLDLPCTPHRLIGPRGPFSNEPQRTSMGTRLIPIVREQLERSLPDFMLPSRFVVLPELPLLPSGKVDRKRLAVPRDRTVSATTPYVAPADDLERLLLDTWCAVIGAESIGTHHDFFSELGGHSLLAARLVARLRSTFDVDVPLQLVFDAPTIALMADALRPELDRMCADADTSPPGADGWITDTEPQGAQRVAR